jgi:phage shock protein PspC (stress-responsive transcriptional regulator)
MTEPSAEIKKIYRSQADRLVAGVAGELLNIFLFSALVRVLLIISP